MTRRALALLALPLLAACQPAATVTTTAPAPTVTTTAAAPASSSGGASSGGASSGTTSAASATSGPPRTSTAATSVGTTTAGTTAAGTRATGTTATGTTATTAGGSAASSSRAPGSGATPGAGATQQEACDDNVNICVDVPAGYTVERARDATSTDIGAGLWDLVRLRDSQGLERMSLASSQFGFGICEGSGEPVGTAVVVRAEKTGLTGLTQLVTGTTGLDGWVAQIVSTRGEGWSSITVITAGDPRGRINDDCDARLAQFAHQADWEGPIRVGLSREPFGTKEEALEDLRGDLHQVPWDILRTAHRRG